MRRTPAYQSMPDSAGAGPVIRTRIKVCCIQDIGEARLALELGADALGLVGPMPNGIGPIEDEKIAKISAALEKSVERFLLTSETEAEEVVAHVARCGTNVVQLVDAVQSDTYSLLRRRHPALRIVQVIHVENDRAIEQASGLATHVDALLLDSGKPSAAVRTLGGTGDTHDWSISRKIVAHSRVPVFLAGGLNPGNVTEAIHQVRPYGVDVCSGLRQDGRLLADRLRDFVSAVRQADRDLAEKTLA